MDIKQKLNSKQNLLAVSKMQSPEKILRLYMEGQRDFGENYIQESLAKIEELKDYQIKWHLIGSIQKNKVKFLKDHFDYIHSVDSLAIAQMISAQAEKINYQQKIFLQLNLAHESTKSGFSIKEFEKVWPDIIKLKSIQVVGLMTMPPLQNEPQQNQGLFKKLKDLAVQYHLTELSMGTSHDYKIALQEGSTWIRLGSLLFGERVK